MDQHTIELLLAALTGPVALGMWSGAGKVLGAIAKRKAEAAAKREEREGEVAVIDAQARKARAEREDTASHRLVGSLEDRVGRAEQRLDRCEERHEECERRNDECEKRAGESLVKVTSLEARLARVEQRSVPPGGE